jgi:hypothetical protein
MAATTEKPQNGSTAPHVALPADISASLTASPPGKSPSLAKQALRVALFVIWFTTVCCCIVATQFIGVPLALLDKNLFYAYLLPVSRLIVDIFRIRRRALGLLLPRLLNGKYPLLGGRG